MSEQASDRPGILPEGKLLNPADISKSQSPASTEIGPAKGLFHDPEYNTESHVGGRSSTRSVSPLEVPGNEKQKMQGFGVNDVLKEQIDLRLASNNPSVVMELDLDGKIRYMSKNWEHMVGTSVKKLTGKPISSILIGSSDQDLQVFNNAISQMVTDNASYKVKFLTATNDVSRGDVSVQSDQSSHEERDSVSSDQEREPEGSVPTNTTPETLDTASTSSQVSNNGDVIELEAQGIVIQDTKTNLPSYSIWTIKPFEHIDMELTIPDALFDLLGFGSEIFEGYLLSLKEAGIIDEDSVPDPKLILCHICETNIPAWFIEKHSDLCIVEHRVSEELQLCHDALAEQRDLILKVSDSLWSQQFETHSGSSSSLSTLSSNSSTSSGGAGNIYDYKGIPLPSMSTEALSPRGSVPSLKTITKNSILRTRKFPFGILSRLLEYCDEALAINPADKDEETGELQFSPNTERAISAVMNWKSLETSDPAIRRMVDDTQQVVNEKMESLTRLISIIQYGDKIKEEVDSLVLQSVRETVARIREKTLQQEYPEQRPRTHSSRTTIRHRSSSSSDSGSFKTPMSVSGSGLRVESNSPSALPPSPLSQAHNLHSPQPSRVRSPPSKLLGEPYDTKQKTSPTTSLHSITPRDFLKGRISPSIEEIARSVSRPGSANSSHSSQTRQNHKEVEEALRDLNITRHPAESSDSSSVSSPRRHLSPTPYTERSNFNTFQRNIVSRMDPSPLSSPSMSHADINNDEIQGVPPASLSKKRTSSSGSNALPTLITNQQSTPSQHSANTFGTPGLGHTRNSLSLSAKPPLSPLLVSQTPASKASTGGIKDYEIIKAISKGAFGAVFLAKRRLTGDYVAIKCLKKRDMIAKNQVLNVRSERAVMMKQSDSPYVAQLYSSFQTKDYLYLVMEYLNGGDCATLLKMLGTLGNKWAKRYIAEVIVGVNDLHMRGIIHRDLKPDNLLIDSAGHLKLTDFGLSRIGVVGRHTAQHRKSSTSEHAIELFRKSISGSGTLPQSPLILGSGDSPELLPSSQHKRTSSVTPFSLSPAMEHMKFKSGSVSTLPINPTKMSTDSQGQQPQRKRSGSLFRNSGTRSGSSSSGFDSPGLKPSLQRTSSESSFAIVDDDFQYSPQQSENNINSFTLYNPEEDEGQTNKFVGTPDYLSPETITGDTQGEYSDWWSIGCILFEFLYGYPPFHADTPDQVFKNILDGKIDWPPLSEEEEKEICPPEAKDLIKKLLVINYEERLGYNGADEIKSHPYFNHINWETLYLESPDSFIPITDDPESTDYFDARGADMSHFPIEDENDDEDMMKCDRLPVSAREVESQDGYFNAQPPPQHLSLPSSPMLGRRERRSSRLADSSEFGSFHFRNLNVLEKANKDVINRLKNEHLEHRNSFSSSSSESTPLGHTKSRGSSISSTAVNPGSPFKRPVSPVANRSQSPVKERGSVGSIKREASISKKESTGSLRRDRADERIPTLKQSTSSLARNILQRNSGDLANSPSTSDSDDSSSALSRVRQRRDSQRRTGSFNKSCPPNRALSADGSVSFDAAGLDVLYCEPIPIVRHTVGKLMEKEKCVVLSISNGDELIRRATSQVKFDLIFTALKLPKVDAIDAVKLIRYTNGINSDTPVIAITGYAKEAQDSGVFDAVLEKPVDSTQMRGVITKFQCQDIAVESDPED
ncbi:hypothetical protein CJJ07_000925 [Candidozyma auris]|nr:hypothetical protein CJJ07_000925 [[Candida] auris]QEL58774.1 hypothetical protein CJJ09_000824 [[Candida] auris]